MPSPTFKKISKHKRDQFLQVSLREFATHDYERASISEIVRVLGIAKGSVYQYFENKWDLYQYLVEDAHFKLLEITQFVDAHSKSDLQLWFVQRAMAEIKFEREFPEEFELLTKTRLSRTEKIASLGTSLMKKERLLIQKAIESVESYQDHSNDLAFITYAVKETYLRELTYRSLADDEIMSRLKSFASTIFEDN